LTRIERAEQEAVLERLRRDARFLAERYRLPLMSLDAESVRVKRRYGICYEDGSIRIRLRHATTGSLLKYSGLVDTLCHELAHLRHFNHGAHFHLLYDKILAYAKRQGVYRPTPRGLRPRLVTPRPAPSAEPRRPVQLELF
jgi:predicted metal-dependent hydrolase